MLYVEDIEFIKESIANRLYQRASQRIQLVRDKINLHQSQNAQSTRAAGQNLIEVGLVLDFYSIIINDQTNKTDPKITLEKINKVWNAGLNNVHDGNNICVTIRRDIKKFEATVKFNQGFDEVKKYNSEQDVARGVDILKLAASNLQNALVLYRELKLDPTKEINDAELLLIEIAEAFKGIADDLFEEESFQEAIPHYQLAINVLKSINKNIKEINDIIQNCHDKIRESTQQAIPNMVVDVDLRRNRDEKKDDMEEDQPIRKRKKVITITPEAEVVVTPSLLINQTLTFAHHSCFYPLNPASQLCKLIETAENKSDSEIKPHDVTLTAHNGIKPAGVLALDVDGTIIVHRSYQKCYSLPKEIQEKPLFIKIDKLKELIQTAHQNNVAVVLLTSRSFDERNRVPQSKSSVSEIMRELDPNEELISYVIYTNEPSKSDPRKHEALEVLVKAFGIEPKHIALLDNSQKQCKVVEKHGFRAILAGESRLAGLPYRKTYFAACEAFIQTVQPVFGLPSFSMFAAVAAAKTPMELAPAVAAAAPMQIEGAASSSAVVHDGRAQQRSR